MDEKKPAEIVETKEDEMPAGHYHSQKDRIFVRSIQGAYNLTEELKRLRSMQIGRAHV